MKPVKLITGQLHDTSVVTAFSTTLFCFGVSGTVYSAFTPSYFFSLPKNVLSCIIHVNPIDLDIFTLQFFDQMYYLFTQDALVLQKNDPHHLGASSHNHDHILISANAFLLYPADINMQSLLPGMLALVEIYF
jgi:hypothetical protein